MKNLDLAVFIVSAVTSLGTIAYVVFTYKIMKSGRKGDILKYTPYLLVEDIVISTGGASSKRSLTISYRLKNVGLTPILNLNTSFKIIDESSEFFTTNYEDDQDNLLLVPSESKNMEDDILIISPRDVFINNNYKARLDINYRGYNNNFCLTTYFKLKLTNRFKYVSELEKNIIPDWTIIKEDLTQSN